MNLVHLPAAYSIYFDRTNRLVARIYNLIELYKYQGRPQEHINRLCRILVT